VDRRLVDEFGARNHAAHVDRCVDLVALLLAKNEHFKLFWSFDRRQLAPFDAFCHDFKTRHTLRLQGVT